MICENGEVVVWESFMNTLYIVTDGPYWTFDIVNCDYVVG